MKKILFVATVFRHFRAFHIPYIEWLKSEGWQVDLMAGGEVMEFDEADNLYPIDIQRSPYSLKNLGAYRQAKEIIEREQYDIVYCHTAMGSVIARLASRGVRKRGKTKVVYVAHGFHFYQGGPTSYWLTYYPIEKFLARYTDALVTINSEDYELTKRKNFRTKSYKIDGIGINPSRFYVATDEQRQVLRNAMELSDNDFVLICIGEQNSNKNQRFIIEHSARLIETIPTLRVLMAGRGVMWEENQAYIEKLGLTEHIKLLGYRSDIPDLVALSDVGISASLREGLPLNLLEALSAGTPVVASANRGHREIITHGENGYLFEHGDGDAFVKHITALYQDQELYAKMKRRTLPSIERFYISNSLSQIKRIFEQLDQQ